MTRTLRTLVCWLLLAALPLQSFALAAGAGAHGGPGHHADRGQRVDDSRHGAPGHGTHERVAQHRPVHHQGTMPSAESGQHGFPQAGDAALADPRDIDPVSAQTSDTVSPAAPGSDGQGGSCGSCASCCLGSTLPSAELRASVDAAMPAPIVAPVAPATAFLTDGPERPPRLRGN